MSEPVRKGNVYSTLIGAVFLVTKVEHTQVTLINIRTRQLSICYVHIIEIHFILIGKPYKQIGTT